MDSSKTPNQSQEIHQPNRLACQACQRKKIKCDRNFPCGQCERSSLHCVPSQRKPRVRHAGKRAVDSELRTRISKLESLVETLSGDPGLPEETSDSDHEPPVSTAEDYSPAVGKYLGSSFWGTLVAEVQSLRDALEDEASDTETELTSPSSVPFGNPSDFDLLICPPSSIYVMPGALAEPDSETALQLYDIYFENVDPVFKISHTPSLKRFLVNGNNYLGQDPSSPSNRALRAATWYAAVTTIRNDECGARFGTSRTALLSYYRRHVDVALAQADLVNTTEMATLQASVIYNSCLRSANPGRRAWTMWALIVRIAHAMGLHNESERLSPFDREIRRRVWHQIRLHELSAAIDRGTVLLVQPGTFTTPLPKNVNDSEFDESSTTIPDHETGSTDMTFQLMAYATSNLTMRLVMPESSAKGETWQQRLDASIEMGKQFQEKYLKYCDKSKPFDKFMCGVANAMLASTALRAVRPLQRHMSSVLPRVDSPYVLQIAVNSLRESETLHSDPDTERWRWVFWVQWHALAVSLAGLCSIRNTELADLAWKYVDQSYARNSKHVADTPSGMLWRPIEKLYRKAAAFRDGDHAHQPFHITPPTSHQPTGISAPDPYTASKLTNPALQLTPDSMPSQGLPTNLTDLNGPGGYGDISWLDWNNIMEDISGVNPPGSIDEFQPPLNYGGDWSEIMPPDMI